MAQITLHQGAIEAIFLDSMKAHNVVVERPIVPTSIELSKSEAELKDPSAHPVKVWDTGTSGLDENMTLTVGRSS